MQVEYIGWTSEKGTFRHLVYVDENRTDYEIQYENGFVSRQQRPFETYTYDWNHDGDIYPRFGAWFESRHGGNEFITPVELVDMLIGSYLGEDLDYNDRIDSIKGIELPDSIKQEVCKKPKKIK